MKSYKYHVGLKVRLYPSFKQKEKIKMFSGASRFMYNRLVSIDRELYKLKSVGIYLKPVQERINYLESLKSVRKIKNSAPFLFDVDSLAVCNAEQNYIRAWKNYREGNGSFPKYRKKSNFYSYQTNAQYQSGASDLFSSTGFKFLDKTHVQLPLLGRIRIKGSKKLIGDLFSRKSETRFGSVKVSIEADDKCYASIQLASDEPFREVLEKTGSVLAFDLNLDNFLTDSNGRIIDNPRYLKQSEERLKRLQRRLSKKAHRAKLEGRKLEDCVEYQKLRKQVASLHVKVRNQRLDFQRKLAFDNFKNHDVVFAENLKVKNMVKNHKLAKAIFDVSWRNFLTLNKIKADMFGKEFILVNPRNTTQTCSVCGHVMKGEDKLSLKVREWTCPECGSYHVRDHNAALNILNRGLEQLS